MHKIYLTYAFNDDYFNQLLSIYYKGDTSFFSLTKVIYHSIIRDMKVVKHSCQGVTFVKYICILFRLFNIDINLLIQTNSCAFQYVLFLNAIKIRINQFNGIMCKIIFFRNFCFMIYTSRSAKLAKNPKWLIPINENNSLIIVYFYNVWNILLTFIIFFQNVHKSALLKELKKNAVQLKYQNKIIIVDNMK